jgi:hypothetical protein
MEPAQETVGAPEALNDNEPVPMSRDASDRTLDRQLAYLGLLDDAAPLLALYVLERAQNQ